MRISAGIGASACLALALAGCANNCGITTVDCPAVPAACAPATPAPTAAAGCPVVAVVPFIGLGDAPASGIQVAEAMARRLNDSGDCVVVAPGTVTDRVIVVAGDDWDPVEAGRKVGARYVVTGRVTDYAPGSETDKPMVGLAARLIDAGTGHVVWTGNNLASAPELPEGGLDALAFAVCGDLAKTIHANMDKTPLPATELAYARPAPANAPASAPAPKAATEADAPETPPLLPSGQAPEAVSETASEATLDVAPEAAPDVAIVEPEPSAKADPDVPTQIVVTRVVDAPAAPAGEGTADWAVPLEEMPEYLESIGSPALASAPADEDLLPAAQPEVEGVGSVLGMEKEEEMTGSLLIPGAVTLDFPDDEVLPESFGIADDEADAGEENREPWLPDDSAPVGEVLSSVASRPALPKDDPIVADHDLGLEEEEESFEDKFSVDSVDLDFFDSLSDSLKSGK